MSAFEKTGLWQRSLGNQAASLGEPLAVLRAGYAVFRDRASALTAQIAKALPNLTIHDVTHLDALWETADLIAGDDYPLNPAEAFVLGGAILLHDAALCFEAYEGGQAGLRETLEWKDAFAAFGSLPTGGADAHDLADFDAMRHLHASRAAQLAEASWQTPEGDKLFLIESHELRKHYAKAIGEIAASHHWPIEDVVSRLPSQINALASMPREWRVDPVKLACLLRCADAAHIDSRRAPDFLRALARIHGVSADHWTAQNWLERADIDEADPHRASILFTSGKSFDEAHAAAWWVAYDTIRLIDRELTSCAEILERRPQSATSPPFRVRRVTGANSPAAASKTISTSGWTPQAVEIHVSNLEQLISRLGGTKLYGDSQLLVIVLRELIQNARDAITARRHLDPHHSGRIRVAVEGGQKGHVISVEDDGVGMSRRVVTGPLLDFGSSFWASELARSEFPGLLSAGNSPVGQFGIGFYSVFMVASAASIASRRFDTGLESVTQLRFPQGLSLRPLVSTGAPRNFGYSTSTVVNLNIQEELGDPRSILIEPGREGYHSEFRLPIKQVIATVCAGLDVLVELSVDSKNFDVVHVPIQNIVTTSQKKKWLEGIVGRSEYREQKKLYDEHISRLRPIVSRGKVLGLAALSTALLDRREGLSTISTVGGLAALVSRSDMTRYFGYIDFEPSSAKREPGPTPSAGYEAVEAWAAEQMGLLPEFEKEPLKWCAATYSIADLQLDPTEIATMLIRRNGRNFLMRLDDVLELVVAEGLAFYQSPIMQHVETHHSLDQFRGMPTFWALRNGSFLSLVRDKTGATSKYSALSCIERRALSKGVELRQELIANAAMSSFGPMPVLILTGVRT